MPKNGCRCQDAIVFHTVGSSPATSKLEHRIMDKTTGRKRSIVRCLSLDRSRKSVAGTDLMLVKDRFDEALYRLTRNVLDPTWYGPADEY